MDFSGGGGYAVALAIILYIVRASFRTPKDADAELESRIRALETGYLALAVKTEGTHGRHEEAIDNLADNVKWLAEEVKRLASRIDALFGLRASGEHRTIP